MTIECTFCNKRTKMLVEGPVVNGNTVYICKKCTEIVSQTFSSDSKPKTESELAKLTPIDIHNFLNEHVIGQDEAKRTLSVAVYNHFKRIFRKRSSSVKIDKSNILLIGPSGCGKTLMISKLAELLDVPIVFEDATTFTEVGYVGKDVDTIIKNLLAKCNNDKQKAERGIVFIDEIDKIARKTTGSSSRDVSGEGVQQGLLKLIEGSEIRITEPGSQPITIDTTNILFVCSGAFDGIDKLINSRLSQTSIGFGSTVRKSEEISDLLPLIENEDLIKYGMIREFIGRLHVKATLNKLTLDDMVKVIKEPKDSIMAQFKELFDIDGASLEFSEEYIKTIAQGAIKHDTGARGLRSSIEKTLTSIQYQLPQLVKDGVKLVSIQQDGTPVYTNEVKKVRKIKQ